MMHGTHNVKLNFVFFLNRKGQALNFTMVSVGVLVLYTLEQVEKLSKRLKKDLFPLKDTRTPCFRM